MTWEELEEEAKKMGDVEIFGKFIAMGGLYFWKDGEVNLLGAKIAKDRTPDQMLAIMKALQ